MAVDPLTPKELKATCNAAIASIEDLVTERVHSTFSVDRENATDAIARLQDVVDALERVEIALS